MSNLPFITVFKALYGWKAVLLTWQTEYEMYSPEQNSYWQYPTMEKAESMAKGWAENEGIEYRKPA